MLSNIRVIDLSRILAGPFCTMMLGDLGADILKIESHEGDDTRRWGPPFVGESAIYFWSINRNKKSIAVDFKLKKGSHLIQKLVKRSDVFVENFVPGKLKKYGLDYETLKEINPNIIYCSITGFGQEGPLSRNSGYDLIAAAMGGLLHITGPENGPPCRVGVAITDILTGMMASNSILAALLQRNLASNSTGCHIDCNLFSTQIAMLFHIGANYLTSGIEANRIGTSHSAIVPYQAFKTSDNRYFVICAGNDSQFEEMCKIINFPELSIDSRFKTNSSRVKNRSIIVDILSNIFEKSTLNEWIDRFSNSRLANGPVNDLKDVFNQPQLKFLSDRLIRSWNTSNGKISVPGNPVSFRTKEYGLHKMSNEVPPKLGEHTRNILQRVLKLDDSAIQSLIDSNVVLDLQ